MTTKKETEAMTTICVCGAPGGAPGTLQEGLCDGCYWAAKLSNDHDAGKHWRKPIEGCLGCAQDAEIASEKAAALKTDRWLIATKVSAAAVVVHIWGKKPRWEDGDWVAGDFITVLNLNEAQAIYGLTDIRTDRPTKITISGS